MVTHIATPSLILDSLGGLAVDADAFATLAGAAVVCFLAFAAVGFTVVRLAGLPVAGYLPAMIFPNCGNMGLPVALFAFGEEGLALGIAYFAVCVTTNFTLGISIAAGGFSLRRLGGNPILYAVAVGIVLVATDTGLPAWLDNTAGLLGGMAIPLMLLALGVSLAELQVRAVGRSLLLGAARMGTGTAVGIVVAEGFGLAMPAYGVLVLTSSMPVAVYTYLFAQQYDGPTEEVAGMIVMSTLLSVGRCPRCCGG